MSKSVLLSYIIIADDTRIRREKSKNRLKKKHIKSTILSGANSQATELSSATAPDSACAGIYRQDNSCITLGMSTMGIRFQAEKETPFLINVVCLATKKQREIHNRHQAAQRDIYDCAIAP